jgi:sugar lactone lactonase YvrE
MKSPKVVRALIAMLLLALGPGSLAHAGQAPAITRIGPDVVSVGDPDFTLRVQGENFDATSTVLLDGNALETTFVSKRILYALVPVDVMDAAGTRAVAVRTGAGVTTEAEELTVQVQTPGTTILRLNPDALEVRTNAFGQEFRIAGTGFSDSSKAFLFGRELDTIRRERGVLSVAVPPNFLRNPALLPFQVRSNGDLSNLFTIPVFARAAVITDLTPGTVQSGSEAFELKINGSSFDERAVVIIDGVTLIPSDVKPQQIKVDVPASLVANPEQVVVVVRQPSGVSNAVVLRVVPSAAPFVYSVSPPLVQAGSPATRVSVIGANFDEDSRVLVNGARVTTEFVGAGRVTFRLTEAQLAAPGVYTITVENPDGGVSDVVTVEVVAAANVSTTAGKSLDGFTDGPPDTAKFRRPSRMALGPDGRLYVADQLNHAVRRLTPENGMVETLAGDGLPGYIDTGDSTDADFSTPRFNNPLGIAVAADGTIFVADYGNNVIRRMVPNGAGYTIDTVAGANELITDEDEREESRSTRRGLQGFADGPGATARFRGPDGLALGSNDTLYVADPLNSFIRAVDLSSATFDVTKIAGIGIGGFADGPVSAARFTLPIDVALSPDETRLYVADFGNRRVRALDLASRTVATLAGNGSSGTTAGTALLASFTGPIGITVAPDETVYVSDHRSNTIRRIEPDGVTTTLAGGGAKSRFRDGIGPFANFKDPRGIVYDASRSVIFVADQGHHRIRRIAP